MEYHFRFSLTEEEFAEFSVYTNWLSPERKKHRIGYMVRSGIYFLICLIAFVAIEFYLRLAKRNSYADLIPFALIGGLLFILFLNYQIPFKIRARVKKMLLKDENKHFLYESELSLNDDGITCSDILSINNYKWPSIVKYIMTKHFFYLYINSSQALVIPKRLFKSQNDIESFDKFLSQKIPISSSFRGMGI